MADNKKYYYLKLKNDFYDTDELVILESMPEGHLYSNILLKLYLKSIKNEGKLMFNDRIPYNPTILAQVTRHKQPIVEKALELFKELGLVEIMDNGAIYMLDIQNYIGQSSTEADRKREYRKQIDSEKGQMSGQMSRQIEDKTTPEIEIEIDKEIEIEIDKEIDKEIEINNKTIVLNNKKSIYKKVVEHLNKKVGTSYKHTTKNTQKLINSREKEGFTEEDFIKVIDTMTAKWFKDPKMNQYLRPQTLFGTKFESYLNTKVTLSDKGIMSSAMEKNMSIVEEWANGRKEKRN